MATARLMVLSREIIVRPSCDEERPCFAAFPFLFVGASS